MLQSFKKWTAASFALAMLVALGAGCAQDVGDIDRTQPDKIEKSIFKEKNEWYYTQTITDTDYQGSILFEALESPLKRIRWEITEEVLYAYSTVDPVEGLTDDQKGEKDKKLGVVAAFPIQSHFDVQRQYNSSTGEPTNVIVENRSDRPWYKREYMRVNWSQNLVGGYGMFNAYLENFAPAQREVPQEEGHIDPNRAQIGKDYIDVTVEYSFQPDLMACFNNLGLDAVRYCEGGRFKARNSFVRITEEMREEKFKPLEYTDNRNIYKNGKETTEPLMTQNVFDAGYYMEVQCNDTTEDFLREQYGATQEGCQPANFDLFERFGYFRTRRIGFDKKRPRVDASRKYYAQRWDIWTTTEDGETIPKPVVYHMNAEYPKDMIPAAKEVQRQWDNSLKEAIMLGSKLRRGKKKAYDSIKAVEKELEEHYDDKHMYKIARNSCHPGPLVEWKKEHGATVSADRKEIGAVFQDALGKNLSGDALKEALWAMPTEHRMQLCADLEWATEQRSNEDAQFTWEQIGDLRYSFFNWVREYNGYWSGYGPSSADPLTGEIISADANFAGTPLRETAAEGADYVQYMNCDEKSCALSNADVRFGEHIRKYIERQKNKRRKQSLSPEEMPAEAEREFVRRAGHDPSDYDFSGDAPKFSEQPELLQRLGKEGLQEEFDKISRANEYSEDLTTRFAKFYEQPQIKSIMMKDPEFQHMVQALAKAQYGPNAGEDAKHQAYLDLASPGLMKQRMDQSKQWMRENNIFSKDNLNRAIQGLLTYKGLAEYFDGMKRKKIERFFLENAFIGTQLHEVGHTMGLRHNFSASMDALNWHDAYWNIQKEALKNEDVTRDLPEEEAQKPYAEQSKHSVYNLQGDLAKKVTGKDVKYANEEEFQQASVMDYTMDLTGRFAGLGKYDQAAINFAYARHVEVWEDDFNMPNLLWYQKWRGDYTDLPKIFGSNDPDANGETAERLRGIEIITEGRKWIPIDKAIENRRDGIEKATDQWQNGKLGGDTKPYVERVVDYNFCSDDRAGYALGCDTFDHGGNHTEVVNHAFNTYRFFQPFWRYKGQKIQANFQNLLRYFGLMQYTLSVAERPFRYWSLYEWLGISIGDYTRDLQKASIDSLNFYAELMATPEPGRYCKYDGGNFSVDENWYYNLKNSFVPANWHPNGGKCENYIDVPRGVGQFYGSDLTDSYEIKYRRVGSYWDKLIATQSFFSISSNWVNSSLITDQRASNITFYSLFKEEMLDWMGRVILGDFQGYSGTYDKLSGTYKPPTVVTPNKFGLEDAGTQEVQTNAPKIRSTMGFNQEINALAGALLVNTSWLDQSVDFEQYIKVVKAETDKVDWGSEIDTKTFTHPVTGVQYTAPQTTDDESISVKLIDWAKGLKQDYEFAKCMDKHFDPNKKADGSDPDKQATVGEYLAQDSVCGQQPTITINTSNQEKIEETRNRIDEFRRTRLRQMEDVVSKINSVRDIAQLTDLR